MCSRRPGTCKRDILHFCPFHSLSLPYLLDIDIEDELHRFNSCVHLSDLDVLLVLRLVREQFARVRRPRSRNESIFAFLILHYLVVVICFRLCLTSFKDL